MSLFHPAAWPEGDLLAECDVRRTRRSGPGGQHRNKVETAVVITHRPTGITVDASERRSQAENRRVALFRLRVQLALSVRRSPEPARGPSALWQSRCRGGKLWINPEHDDFPSLLAEALDAVSACEDDARAAAESLGCTPSQLTKFLRLDPRALALVNAARLAKGLRKLQ